MKSYQSIYGTVSEDITTQTVTPTNHQLKIHNNTCKQEVLHTCVWQAVGRIRHHMGKKRLYQSLTDGSAHFSCTDDPSVFVTL